MDTESYFLITERTSSAEIEERAESAAKIETNFGGPVAESALNALEKILKTRTDVKVRFFGFGRSTFDLEILSLIPSVTHLVANCMRGEVVGFEQIGKLKNLSCLKIGIECLPSFNFLNEIPDSLDILYLEGTKRKNLSLEPLRRFSKLRRLYLEGHKTDIETVSRLSALEEVVLRSVTVGSLEFLIPLTKLRLVDLKLGGTTNLGALRKVPNLCRLEIWQVRKLMEVDVLADLIGLQTLHLEDLPKY